MQDQLGLQTTFHKFVHCHELHGEELHPSAPPPDQPLDFPEANPSRPPLNDMAATTSKAHITIIVNKGSPLDYPQYRHTALWVQYPSKAKICHATGTTFEHIFQAEDYDGDPTLLHDFAHKVEVGFLATALVMPQLVEILRKVEIDNSNWEFNCQTWVERALNSLKGKGLISGEQYERGVNGMVDAIAEAEDVEE